MFTVAFRTDLHSPDEVVVIRTAQDDWSSELPGVYIAGAWTFEIADDADGTFQFKFLVDGRWMDGPDLVVTGGPGHRYEFDDTTVVFPAEPAVVTENGRVQKLFFAPVHDEAHEYDVIVVGSGMGGGILADQLSDAGADVLVLEAGSYLFPTHVANLPRRLRIGRFDKHVWGLFTDFSVQNYTNVHGSVFAGRQAFNLGGRSLFWGGLIPRMGAWELDRWPGPVRDYLLTVGYRLAEDALNRSGPMGSGYQELVKSRLAEVLPSFDHLDAPVAVQYQGYTPQSIPGGMFSTADLLLEDRLVVDPGRAVPAVNLNTVVRAVRHDGGRATGVDCYDSLARRPRSYTAAAVVLSAGTIESAKIALASGLDDPTGLIGWGLTDHPILYTHFSLPQGAPLAVGDASAKVWSRHRDTSATAHPYNIVLEAGADFNQGRYVDPDHLAAHKAAKRGSTLGEIVFLFDCPIVEGNRVALGDNRAGPVRVDVRPYVLPGTLLDEVRDVSGSVLAALGAEPVQGESLDLAVAALGAVAHEVGTLRMGAGQAGVVDSDLRFQGYENLYACDNSVFPSSPAANPSLTLAALAMRLADRLAGRA